MSRIDSRLTRCMRVVPPHCSTGTTCLTLPEPTLGTVSFTAVPPWIFAGSPRTLPTGTDAAGGTAVKFYDLRDNLRVLAVVGLVVAFSLSSTLVKRAESPGVLVAFWRMVVVSVVWNAVL